MFFKEGFEMKELFGNEGKSKKSKNKNEKKKTGGKEKIVG